MYQQEDASAAQPEMQMQSGGVELDDFAAIVQEKFEAAKEYRRDHEIHWEEAYSAYRAKYPSRLSRSNELAQERGIFVNETRRKVNSAKIKIGTLLFEDGKIPFSVTPSRRPRYIPPDIQVPPDRPDLIKDQLVSRAEGMEDRIRDILDRVDYNQEVQHAIHEMCLFGTGCTKGIQLERKNYPVFQSSKEPGQLQEIEMQLEEELVPCVKYVSIWNIFPSPEALSSEDADWVIQRSFLSEVQLRELGESQEGFVPGAIDEVINNRIGEVSGEDTSEHPRKFSEGLSQRVKKYEVLEFWGMVNGNDLAEYLPVEAEEIKTNIPIVATIIGDKVVKVSLNPLDKTIPYHFCYWQKNPESIWGDGIYYSIRDTQAILNFCYAMMVEGKSLSAAPLTVIDPNSFEAGTNTEEIYPGKQFKVKPGASVRDAFQSIVIPDVTNGLLQIVQQLERQSDLDSGQTAIGYGDQSPSQTKTATGMSILNSNANRQTADVVRSVSNMITKNVQAVYRWLMVDSDDPMIKGDYEAICTGFESYLSKEVQNSQLINFLQVSGNMPQFQEYIKFEAFTRPLLRAFNLDPELMLKTEEQVAQEQQAAQQNAIEMKRMELQMQAEFEGQKEQAIQQAEHQFNAQMAEMKALLDEKQNVSGDVRALEMQERLELLKQGNVLNPPDIQTDSILIREEEFKAGQQLAQQMKARTDAEMQAKEQLDQQYYQRGEQRVQRMEGKMREGLMKNAMGQRKLAEIELERRARKAQERQEGGPPAKQVQKEQQQEQVDAA